MSTSHFFVWENNLDEGVIGSTYPQIQAHVPKTIDARELELLARGEGGVIDAIDGLKLDEGCRFTDILSNVYSSDVIICNDRVRSILEHHSIGRRRCFPCKVYHHSEVREYFWVQLMDLALGAVHFASSDFVIRDANETIERVRFSSAEEIFRMNDQLKATYPDSDVYVWSDHIVVDSNRLRGQQDLFKIGRVDDTLYMSRSLAETFIDARVTGGVFSIASRLTGI